MMTMPERRDRHVEIDQKPEREAVERGPSFFGDCEQTARTANRRGTEAQRQDSTERVWMILADE
jgi:hypothetical protein